MQTSPWSLLALHHFQRWQKPLWKISSQGFSPEHQRSLLLFNAKRWILSKSKLETEGQFSSTAPPKKQTNCGCHGSYYLCNLNVVSTFFCFHNPFLLCGCQCFFALKKYRKQRPKDWQHRTTRITSWQAIFKLQQSRFWKFSPLSYRPSSILCRHLSGKIENSMVMLILNASILTYTFLHVIFWRWKTPENCKN